MTTGEIHLRPAAFGDVDAIANIHYHSRRIAMPWLTIVHSALETRGYVSRIMLKTLDTHVAIDDRDVVLGYAAWRADRNEAWLHHLYIHPEQQGCGVGTMLLARAKRAMPSGFEFWVFQRNSRARSFYEKHGCHAVRETDGRANEEREPDVLYRWG